MRTDAARVVEESPGTKASACPCIPTFLKSGFMDSEIRSSSNPNPEKSMEPSIERILLRKDRVFKGFVVAGLLIAGLIVLAIFLRWDF
jgi:hypothetical protein